MAEKSVIRVTKAQKFEVIKNLIPSDAIHTFPGGEDKDDYIFTYDEMIDFLNNEINLLAKKNSSDSKKQTETQKINESLKEEIVELLGSLDSDSPGMTCTEIIKAKDWFKKDYGVSKVSRLCRDLKMADRIVSKSVKGKTYFSLA